METSKLFCHIIRIPFFQIINHPGCISKLLHQSIMEVLVKFIAMSMHTNAIPHYHCTGTMKKSLDGITVSRLNFVKRLVKILIFWLICKDNFAIDRLISISLSFSASIVNL